MDFLRFRARSLGSCKITWKSLAIPYGFSSRCDISKCFRGPDWKTAVGLDFLGFPQESIGGSWTPVNTVRNISDFKNPRHFRIELTDMSSFSSVSKVVAGNCCGTGFSKIDLKILRKM